MKSENKRCKYFNALKQNKLLTGLSEKDILLSLDYLEEEILPRNTCSIGRLRTSTTFYFIIEGRLKAYQIEKNSGREFTFFILKNGDVFDILCLLDGCEHDIYYESLDRVILLKTPLEQMQAWVKEKPDLNKTCFLT